MKKNPNEKFKILSDISKLIRNKPRPRLNYGCFHSETPNVFHPHYAGESWKNATITVYFAFAFDENSGWEITWLFWRHHFRKTPFSKTFLSTLKRKANVFKYSRPNRINKAAFSNFSGIDQLKIYVFNPRTFYQIPRVVCQSWSDRISFWYTVKGFLACDSWS